MKIDRYPDRLLKTQNTLPHSRAFKFAKLFPDGMEMTEENILKAIQEGLDVLELIDRRFWEGNLTAEQAIRTAFAERRTAGQDAITASNDAKSASRHKRERQDLQALREFDEKRKRFEAEQKRADELAEKTYREELDTATQNLAKALASAIASAELSQTASVS